MLVVGCWMGDCLGEAIRITTSGPVIIDAASLWYSITGWGESLDESR